MYLCCFQDRFSLVKLYAKRNYFHIGYGPALKCLKCKHSAPVDVYLYLAYLAYVSPFENLRTLLTVTVTFKQQANFNSINICYFDWRTFKLNAYNPDLILECVVSVCNTSLILIYPTWPTWMEILYMKILQQSRQLFTSVGETVNS